MTFFISSTAGLFLRLYLPFFAETVTPDKVFINRWKKLRVIEIIDKNTFRKLKKGGEV